MKRSIALVALAAPTAQGDGSHNEHGCHGEDRPPCHGGGASAESLLVVAAAAAGVVWIVAKKRRARHARNLLIVAGDPVLAKYDDNRNARISCREARRHGIAPTGREHPAYPYLRDLDEDGIACE